MSVINSIFEDSAGGIGYYSITRRLNQENIPTFGPSDGWQTSYVAKIPNNRAVRGEFQPYRVNNGKRVPDGDPIMDYFPQIVDEQLFYRSQSGRAQRITSGAGRKGQYISNLFSGIAKCAYCKSRMRFENKGARANAGAYLVCDRARRGLDSEKTGWRYDHPEASFLTYVQEIDLASLVHAEADNAKRRVFVDDIAALSGQLTTKNEERERTYDLFIKSGSKIEFAAQKLAELEQDVLRLTDVLQQRAKELIALNADLGRFYESTDQIKTLVQQCQSLDDQDAHRLRSLLASRLKSIIVSMSVATVGTTRLPSEHDWEHWRYFLLEFKDGSARAVYPDPDDPTQFAVDALLT